jgi:hypothetical protein
MRKQRELDDAKRELKLTIETKVQESLNSARDEGRRLAEQSLSLKVREREETSMQRQIADLRRRSRALSSFKERCWKSTYKNGSLPKTPGF